MSQLVTGEAVMLHLRPARIASRMLARGLDLGIELAALWVLGQVVGLVAVGDPDIAIALGIVIVVGFIVGYPVVLETFWRGLTPGKAALGLRVVRDDGGPIRFRHALTRGLLNLVDIWLTAATVGVISSLLSQRGKRIGDIVAGTFVIQERMPRQYVAPIFMPPQLASWAATLDLSRLPDDLALAVRGFLGRAGELRPEARERLGAELAAAVGACVTPPPPAGTPGWAYLAAVVAERRRRDEARIRPSGVPPGWGGAPGAGGPVPPGVPSPWQPAAPSPGWHSGGTPPPGWGPATSPPASPPPPAPPGGSPAGSPGWPAAAGASSSGTWSPGASPPGGSSSGSSSAPAASPATGASPASPGTGASPAAEAPTWGASAPPTGTSPPVGAPPAVGPPPPDPGPPRLPSAPSPQWGPTPVPPAAPPAPTPARRRRAAADADPHPAAPEGGFAVPD